MRTYNEDDDAHHQRPNATARTHPRFGVTDAVNGRNPGHHVHADRLGPDRQRPLVVDTSIEEGRIALLSGVGGGKTTICRFLTRCWAVQESEHCVVLTSRVHECADLHRDNVHILSNLDHDQDARGPPPTC